jgi:hypothetical protein
MYYWLSARDETGKPFLIYGGRSESEARERGLEVLNGADFEIKKFPTVNLSRASSMMKGNRLEKTHSLKKASRRLGHEKSLKRFKKSLKRFKRRR